MIIVLAVVLTVLALFLLTVLKGAPYVPSRKPDITKALTELYRLGANDLLVDIGSGDGVVLREAARRGANALGFEINPVLVLLSRRLSRSYPTVEIKLADFWRVKLPPETTVVYTFGEGRDIDEMGQWVERQAVSLNKEIFLISYGFELKNYSPIKKVGAHILYRFAPLQETKP